MKRYKKTLLYLASTMSSNYNCCDRWHAKCIIKKLIVSVQNFWYAPCIRAMCPEFYVSWLINTSDWYKIV